MHPSTHLFVTIGAIVALLALTAVVRNHVIRRRLLVSTLFGLLVVAVHLAISAVPESVVGAHGPAIEQLLGAFAIINALISLLLNPWRQEGLSDRTPAIVQDAVIVALVIGVSMFVFNNTSFLTGSAIGLAVLGFALQDTLGNLFAGLSIQIERPFRVGHWITVGSYEGVVTAVTWRATKIRTKSGNLVSVPNNIIGKESINNYSEPAAPTRIYIDVGVGYQHPPSEVRAAIGAVLRDTRSVRKDPAPEILLQDFGGSAITYRVKFWIDDFSRDEQAQDAVRTGIWYEFTRRGIEIPWPIQIQYERQEIKEPVEARVERLTRIIARVPVLQALFLEGHRALAAHAREHVFGDGETIVREGQPGCSMFIVSRGTVAITLGPAQHEVARTGTGGYFGEMSLLTGDPRTATVTARGDCTVIEIDADAFREYVTSHPEVIDGLAAAAAERRRELDQSRAVASAASADARVSLADRMRRFFGL